MERKPIGKLTAEWLAESDCVLSVRRRRMRSGRQRSCAAERGTGRSLGKRTTIRDIVFLREIFRRLEWEQKSSDPSSLKVTVVWLNALISVIQRSSHPIKTQGSDSRLAQAREMMQKQFNENLKVRDIAKKIGMSETYFRERFKKEFGYTPKFEMMHQRILHIQELLLETDDRLDQIAQESGFTDQQELSRAFKKCVGVPPGKWRKLHGS